MSIKKPCGLEFTVGMTGFNKALKRSVDAVNAAGMKTKDLVPVIETGTLRKSIKP